MATAAETKRANGRAEVEVAKGEVVDNGPKAILWHGRELMLPAELPASFFFDMTDAEMEGDDEGGSFAVHAVRDLLGPEQWRGARAHAVEKGLPQQAFVDLVTLVYQKYGMGSGGITGLVGLLIDNWGPIEADFQRVYNMDLRHLVFVARVGVRRLDALVRNLPPDAAVWRRRGFAPDEELLATLIERADAWHSALLNAAAGAQKIETPGLIRIPRPGQQERQEEGRRPTSDVREIQQWFASVN